MIAFRKETRKTHSNAIAVVAGGTYAVFGGRDASRGLATFQITSSGSDEYDDLSDLNSHEMESMREWEMQFKEKYYLVGRLLRPGEKPTNYSDEDEDTPTDSSDVRKRSTAATKATEESNASAGTAAPAPATSSHQKEQSVDSKAPGDGDATSAAGTESDKPKAE